MSKIQKTKGRVKGKGEKPVRRQALGIKVQKENRVCY